MGIFFKDTTNKSTKKDKQGEKNSQIEQKIQSPMTSIPSQVISNVTGVADEKFVQMMMDVIAQNNIPGQDYFEFKQTLDAMSSLAFDERSKFITIFTTLKLQGCTKEDLVKSIDTYISVIEREKSNFQTELINEKHRTVDERLGEVQKAQDEILKLNQKITELNTFVLQTTQEVQQTEFNLKNIDANFNESAQKVINMLNSDKQKIETFIQ